MAPDLIDVALLFTIYLLGPLIWIIGLIFIGFRLKRLQRWSPKGLLLWTGVCTAIYGTFAVAVYSGSYKLTLQVLDPLRKEPLPDVTVSYSTRHKIGRLGRYFSNAGSIATTDASGIVKLRFHHSHRVHFLILGPSFKSGELDIQAAEPDSGHQIDSDRLTWIGPQIPVQPHVRFTLTPQSEYRLVVALEPGSLQ